MILFIGTAKLHVLKNIEFLKLYIIFHKNVFGEIPITFSVKINLMQSPIILIYYP